MRTLRTPDLSQYSNLVLSYFNLIFGKSSKSSVYWRTVLKDSIKKRFISAFAPGEEADSFDLRTCTFMIALFQRLQVKYNHHLLMCWQDLLGIELKTNILNRFAVNEDNIALLTQPLVGSDLLKMFPIVKY